MKTYLNEAMERLNFDEIKLSEATGISMAQLIKYRLGKPTPSLEHAAKIAKALSITIDELVYGIEDFNEEEEEIATTEECKVEDDFEADDDRDNEPDPSYVLEVALQQNKNLNIITSSNIHEVCRLRDWMESCHIPNSIYAKKSTLSTSFTYFVVFELANGLTINDAYRLSKRKLFDKTEKTPRDVLFRGIHKL